MDFVEKEHLVFMLTTFSMCAFACLAIFIFLIEDAYRETYKLMSSCLLVGFGVGILTYAVSILLGV